MSELGSGDRALSTAAGTLPDRSASGSGSAGRLGMWLFLVSLSILFAASLIGYLVIRLRAPEWPPPGSSGLPGGLWISTAVLVVLSVAMVIAERAITGGERRRLTRMLGVALLLAVAFLGAQIANWSRLAADAVVPQESLLTFGFFVLTFLHAVHVLGGLVPLTFVTLRASRGRYSAENHEGVHLVGMYWHFLLATWIAIFIVLLV